jgi:hypothetical protein
VIFLILQCNLIENRLDAEHSEKQTDSGETDWWKGFDTSRVYFENYYKGMKLNIFLYRHQYKSIFCSATAAALAGDVS